MIGWLMFVVVIVFGRQNYCTIEEGKVCVCVCMCLCTCVCLCIILYTCMCECVHSTLSE